MTGRTLPGLLAEVQATVRATTGEEQRRVWAAACHTYHLIRGALRRLGEFDLGMLVRDRAMLAAKHAEDPLLVALSAWHLSHGLCAAGHPEQAHDLALDATALLDRWTAPTVGTRRCAARWSWRSRGPRAASTTTRPPGVTCVARLRRRTGSVKTTSCGPCLARPAWRSTAW
ncbi:MAG: hypothetical protein ACRDYX_17535 [Egibacteraceae bacterium]